MLNWPAGVVGDPTATAKACAEPGRSMVGVVICSQYCHYLKMNGFAKIEKYFYFVSFYFLFA